MDSFFENKGQRGGRWGVGKELPQDGKIAGREGMRQKTGKKLEVVKFKQENKLRVETLHCNLKQIFC